MPKQTLPLSQSLGKVQKYSFKINCCLFKGRGNPETVISGDNSSLFHNKNTTIAFPSPWMSLHLTGKIET